jgi:NAD(P)-dependent dehydrogenase (short-subunit alcohol dehydrogenase family)
MRDVAGKVAVVTGAASGIGRALAEGFAARDVKLVLADVDTERLQEVQRSLTRQGAEVTALRCDVSVEEDVDALAAHAVATFGTAHLVCNNAGIIGGADPWTAPMSVWHQAIGVNVYGVVHGIRAFLPILTAQGEGHIVNTASMAGLTAMPGAVPYGASKHAVVAITEALHLELRFLDSPIGVSCLCPGFVRTDLAADAPPDPSGPSGAPDDPVGSMILGQLRDGIASGVEPRVIAQQVVDAVTTQQFWILTHPESRGAPVARMRRAARQENPEPRPDGRHPELARLRAKARALVASVRRPSERRSGAG